MSESLSLMTKGAMGPITFFNSVSTVWKNPFEISFFFMGFRSSALSSKPNWTSWKIVLDVLNSSHLRASPISETVFVPLHRADTFHCSPVRLMLSGFFWGRSPKNRIGRGNYFFDLVPLFLGRPIQDELFSRNRDRSF